ncbi:Homeobox-leucine zipper protein HDG8 [Hirschfeldia incana]|nr:Homeobox-leucine zipper protein HDG8 [Hirschfeldia incana]
MDYDGDGSPDNEQYASVNAMSKEKKSYHRHSPQQIQILEAYFKECPHPNESQRQKLCDELNLEIDQVKFWFQNKRTQSKAQDERNSNILLRAENERIQCENDAMKDALKNVTCPPCGGPPFGIDERERNVHNLRLENALLKAERDNVGVSENNYQQIMLDSLTSAQRQQAFESLTSYRMNACNPFEQPSSSESQTIQPQLLSQMDIPQLSETAAIAVEELKRLFFTDEALWVMSSIDGTYVIDQESYEKFSHSVKHFRNLSSHVESSKDVTVVPIEATRLIEMFVDSDKWKMLFPTIVNNAKTIHTLGSELPIKENCNVLQVIWEQLHILSPLVPPREFMIVRCCQKIDDGLWIIADVSHNIVYSDQVSPSCYKGPSGCLIRALPNAQTEVMWIEHVEVNHTPDTHRMYRELVSGGSGYGARRWIVTLERMCERMALSSILIMPATDWSETIPTVEGRRSVMKLGERMLKIFNEMLIMSGKVEFPQQSKCGVRISIRMNMETGQLPGLVVSAASCLSIPLTPLQVFNCLRSNDTRHKWDVLCHENVITETARIFTGSNETNYINLLQPTLPGDIGKNMEQEPHKKMMVLQECYMDALGGMIVYAPLDMATMSIAASGEVDPLNIPILPSGFTISRDNSRGSLAGENGGTVLMLAFQILVSDGNSRNGNVSENSVDSVSRLISRTVQSIKVLLNCPPE